MADAEYDLRKDLDQLRSDLSLLRADMSEMVHSVMEVTKQEAGEARSRAQAELGKRARQLQDTYDQMRDGTSRVVEGVADGLEHHPLSSLGIAFGIGLVIGRILGK